MKDEPLTHIMRTSLPWRAATKTVCGRPTEQYRADLVVPLADAVKMRQRLGQQRFALAICMTCANCCNNWSEWDTNPVARMLSEVSDSSRRRDPVVEAELRAIADLIAAHRDEFDNTVEAYTSGGVVTMSDLVRKRQARERRS